MQLLAQFDPFKICALELGQQHLVGVTNFGPSLGPEPAECPPGSPVGGFLVWVVEESAGAHPWKCAVPLHTYLGVEFFP